MRRHWHRHLVAIIACCRQKGDYGFNNFHNSNPQHGGSYGRHERRLRDDEFEDFLKSVKGWDHDPDTHTIWRSFYFDTFDDAYLYMGKLYAFCYGTDKYPHVTWDNTRIDVSLYSPSFKGLSKREARIAAFMNDHYNIMKKSKLQSSKLIEIANESPLEAMFGAGVRAELEARKAEREKPIPEAKSVHSWKKLMDGE